MNNAMKNARKITLLTVMLLMGSVVTFSLALAAFAQDPNVFPATKEDLVGPIWQWDQWIETHPASLSVVPDPAKYTLSFSANNIVNIQADCNQASGTYILRNGKLQIELGPSTLAYCGDQSLDQQFLALLSQVESAGMAGEQLQLALDRNAGYLGLRPGNQVGIAPQDISLDTQGLPYSWQANVVPATAYDASQAPGPMGLPEHIEINFGNTDPANKQPGDPIMYIIPVDAYRDLWTQAGNDYVDQTIAKIFTLTVALPAPAPVMGLPVLPPEEFTGVNDLSVQLDRPVITNTSATKNGYRFSGRWAQSPNPLINGDLDYVYQGFTNDGRYLVSFSYPVTNTTLPNGAVTAEEVDQVNSDPSVYLQSKADALNASPAADWEPPLATLDALVASLQITGMVGYGLEGTEWRPFATTSAPGAQATLISDPYRYSVSYAADGTMSYVADCNSGIGTYTVDGGMVGSIRTTLGATTLAACGPDSYYNDLVNTLMSAQNYKLLPGGKRMELIRPAGGGSLILELVGPAAPAAEVTPEATAIPTTQPPAQPTPAPTIPLPTPGPQVPMGRVIAPDGVNVRSGPGTQYAVVAFAPFGTTAQLAGRSADGQWWAAVAPSLPGGLGWVSATYVQATNAQNLPILPAPPLAPVPTQPPVQPAPTSTPAIAQPIATPPAQPAQPIATPPPAQPAQPIATPPPAPVIQFSANPTSISQGQCTQLNWNVENVSGVWVYPQGANYVNYPVVGVGSSQECPQSTTTYEMRVLLQNGSVDYRSVTVNVEANNPLSSTKWSLASINRNGVLIPGTAITLNFDDFTGVYGKGGCNDYNGTYTVKGATLLIGGISTTRMACEQTIEEQEQFYLTTLQGSSSYQLQGQQLVIFNASGEEILRYNKN